MPLEIRQEAPELSCQVNEPINCTASELSTFLQALGEGYFPTYYSDINPCVPSRSMTIASKSFPKGKRTVSFRGSRFSMTLEPSMGSHGADTSMLSPAASPAKTSASPERVTALTESEADCGPKWPGSLARYNPGSRSWRTRQCSLLGGLTEFSATFPRWGMVRPMASLEHITREHRINATEYGYSDQDCEAGQLPHQDNSAEIVCDLRMRDDQTAVCVWSLGGRATLYEAEILFTEMQGCRRGEGRGIKESISPPGEAYAKAAMRAMRIGEQVAGASYRQGCIEQHADELANALRELSQYVALERQEGQWKLNIGWDLIPMEDPVPRIEGNGSGYWPTPRANERCQRNSQDNGVALSLAVKLVANTPSGNWPTPTCADAFTDKLKSSQQQEGSMHSVNLSQAVKMWPTPVATMHKGSSPASLTRKSGADRTNDRLDHAVMASNGGQLNPEFVEYLMHWPRNWTSLEPMRTIDYLSWLMGSKHESENSDTKEVRQLRNDDDAQVVRQQTGGHGRVQAPSILFPKLCEHESQAEELQPSGEEVPEGSVRSMRVGGEATSASQGSGPVEQHAGEHSNPLRQLPHRTPLEGGESEAEESPAFLRRLREALGSQPLRNPSDTPEEVWQRATCEEKDWIRVAAIRGVWHSEWPGVPRVAVGIAKRADRLKCIGNGQVPAAAALAWRTLYERIAK